MTAAESLCKKGGVIILVAACNDGHGGEAFFKYLCDYLPEELERKVLSIPMDETLPDQWEFQILARILKNHTVIIVTDQCDPKMIINMHMKHAYTLQEAISLAESIKGNDVKFTVIPDGVSVIPDVKG